MRVLISLISFQHLTGSELYVYELAKQLKAEGHDVLVTAPEVGGEITDKTRLLGIEVYSFEKCPRNWNPDVLHLNEHLPAIYALTAFPGVPAITSVHSQFYVEKPFVSDRIYKYICIRPQIQDKVVDSGEIPLPKTTVIYNGVDFERFKREKKNKTKGRVVLFVGTIDPLRKKAIFDLIDDAKKKNYKVIVVGKKHDTYLDNPPSHVEVYGATWDVQKYLELATETAGILLGRTTIEGWAVGLPGWIYDIDLEGNVLSKKLHQPPKDVEKFNIKNVTSEILKLYTEAIAQGETDWDEISKAEAESTIVAAAAIQGNHINYFSGKLNTQTELINFLGSENYDVHLKMQNLEARLDELSKQNEMLSKRLRPLIIATDRLKKVKQLIIKNR